MKPLEIKQIRWALRLFQHEMAERLGTSTRQYQKYEAGVVELPKAKAKLLKYIQEEIKKGP